MQNERNPIPREAKEILERLEFRFDVLRLETMNIVACY